MKKIDIYVAKRFIMFYAATLFGFITMLVVVDISGKIGFLSREGNFITNFFRHYMEEIPFILNMLLPIISVIAAVFTIIGLKKSNELVCLLSSGVSIHRVLLPIIILLGMTVPLFYINSEIIVPYLSRNKPDKSKHTLITTITTPGFVSISSANSINKSKTEANDLSVTIINRATGRLELFLYTPRVQWIPEQELWDFKVDDILLKSGTMTTIDASLLDALISPLDPILFPSPERLLISSRPPSNLSLRELGRINPSRHADIERYHRLGFPFVMFLLLFLAIPFSVGQEKNVSAFLGVGIALGFIFIIYGLMYTAIFIGGKGLLPPVIAGLAPFLIFGPLAALIYRKIRT